MAQKKHTYTALGWRIARLAHNQEQIATVLGLSQQSVSGKLRGEIAISLEDLVLLAKYFHVSPSYFFLDENVSQALLAAWDKLLQGPEELQIAVALASELPREFSIQLYTTVRAMDECLRSIQTDK